MAYPRRHKQMLHALESTRWRLVLNTNEKTQRQKDAEYKEEQRRLREEARLAAELAAQLRQLSPAARCPICTLMPPCSPEPKTLFANSSRERSVQRYDSAQLADVRMAWCQWEGAARVAEEGKKRTRC